MVAVATEPWQGVLSSFGTRLYEEYGRHESLQSCVRKYKEAGRKFPEDLGALEWLLVHHTPEVAEREGRDPLDVLLTTVLLGCCDVDQFIRAVVRCLEDDPALGRSLQMALREFGQGFREFYQTSLGLQVYMLHSVMCVAGLGLGFVSRLVLSLSLLIVTRLYRKPSATMYCIYDLSDQGTSEYGLLLCILHNMYGL